MPLSLLSPALAQENDPLQDSDGAERLDSLQESPPNYGCGLDEVSPPGECVLAD